MGKTVLGMWVNLVSMESLGYSREFYLVFPPRSFHPERIELLLSFLATESSPGWETQ